ncbi:MAG: lysylphosphatidylglycerol synthase domain-containing protein [Anaerolineae bacterium]
MTISVVGLSFLYLGNNIVHGLKQIDLTELKPQPIPLILALLLYTSAVLIGGWCWSLIMMGLGQRFSLRSNIKVHLSANIVKYLPGYGWQILGKAYLCNCQGIPKETIGVGIALEFFSIILTGLWVVIVTLPSAWLQTWGLVALAPWRLLGIVTMSLLLIAMPRVVDNALRYFGKRRGSALYIEIDHKPLWLMLFLMIFAWFILGLTLYMLTMALYPVASADLPTLIFAWAASSIGSLAVLFVPTGIGVKEGMLTFLLGFRLPVAMAAIVAVLARLISILSEVFCFWVAQQL